MLFEKVKDVLFEPNRAPSLLEVLVVRMVWRKPVFGTFVLEPSNSPIDSQGYLILVIRNPIDVDALQSQSDDSCAGILNKRMNGNC